jgi:hypothetical protein
MPMGMILLRESLCRSLRIGIEGARTRKHYLPQLPPRSAACRIANEVTVLAPSNALFDGP